MRAPLLALAAVPLIGATPVATLDVSVAGLRSTKGLIQVCLTNDPRTFPTCVDDADAVARSVPAGTRTLRFDGLPRGDYALALIHDENGNSRLDTVAGIPREGFGFSRNPAILFGPPRFKAARFTVASDAAAQQVKMRYIF